MDSEYDKANVLCDAGKDGATVHILTAQQYVHRREERYGHRQEERWFTRPYYTRFSGYTFVAIESATAALDAHSILVDFAFVFGGEERWE